MAQTGILDYQRYLNTLQTLNNLGQTFPTNKQTYNFSVTGSTTASWTATVSWETLILDKVSFSSKASGYVPNVDNSQVIGYFEGSTTTQYSTGVISIPANMYTGPILPGGDFNVPLTVVHLSWFDGTTRYAQQIGFIQNWEPGVEIGDPTLDFNYFPVYSIPSTLTLTGEAGIVYGDNLTLVATTDMSIDLGVDQTRVRFYRVSTGTDIVLGNAYFTGTVATLVLPTNPSLPIGTYNIYASSQPRGVYRGATSNTLNVRVEAGVPLIVTTSTFTPNLSYYYPGQTVNYRLGVIADPAFTATGVAIANPISIKLVNAFTPFTETNILSGNFIAGQTNTNFTVQSSMIDVTRTYPQTTWSITTSTQNSTQYTATIFVYNTETVSSSWGYQTAGRYRAGSTSTSINVGTSTQVTVTGQAFPLTITQSSGNTYYDEAFSITVGTNTATYYTNISIVANNGSTSTTLYSGNNSGTSSFTVNNLVISTTGTWTITASYPGDLGSSLINANLPSTSNTLTHIVRLGQTLLPTPIVTTERTASADIITITANTSTTLTNTLTYFHGVSNLGTSTWVRFNTYTATTVTTVLYVGLETAGRYLNGGFERNWDAVYAPSLRPYGVIYPWQSAASGPYWEHWYGSANHPAFPPTGLGISLNNIPVKVNPWRLFKYYDGTNYNLSAVTGTNYDEIADPISYGTTWNSDFVTTVNTDGKSWHYNRYILNVSSQGPTIDPVKINVYDIYRIDLVGDTRGYNVVGLDASVYNGPTNMTTSTAFRLYFKVEPYQSPVTGIFYGRGANPVKTRYIDLVEYIGEVEWSKPFENSAQEAGTQPRSTIKVKLFRFTPTIPQTNRTYKTTIGNTGTQQALLPNTITTSTAVNGIRVVEFSTSLQEVYPYNLIYNPNTSPNFREWFNDPSLLKYSGYVPAGFNFVSNGWIGYGTKLWQSTNPGNAEADDFAEFCNEWNTAFGVGVLNVSPTLLNPRRWRANATSMRFDPILSTSTTYTATPTNIQTGTLTLPYNTLPDSTGVHVSWPGTLGLPVEYGRYNGFDIYTLNSPRVVAITATNISVYGANSGETTLSQVEYATNKVYPTNPIKLTAFIQASQYQFDGGAAINTGTVEFINYTTGAVITSTNITNSLATVYLYANNLTTETVSTTATTGVSVIIQPRVVGATSASIATITLQVFNYAGFTYLPMVDNFTATNYSSAPSYTITNTSEPWTRRGIPTTAVKTFTRDPAYSYFVSLGGTIEIVAPYFVKGKNGWYNLGDYFPIYSNISSLYITVSSRSFGSWPDGRFPAGYNDAMVTMTNSNVPGTYKSQSGWSGRYKIEASSYQDKPNIVTLTFSEKLLWLERLNWQNPAGEVEYIDGQWGKYQVLGDGYWTTCDIRISVEAYDDLNNLVATLPANTLLGYKTNLYLRTMEGWQPPVIYEFI